MANERFQYAAVRQEMIDALKIDLMGPQADDEVLTENPASAYIVGFLAPLGTDPNAGMIDKNSDGDDTDIDYGDDADYSADDDEDKESTPTRKFKLPSSIGLSFYIDTDLPSFELDVRWGEYTRISIEDADPKAEKGKPHYARIPMQETLTIHPAEFDGKKEVPLVIDSEVVVTVNAIALKNNHSLVTCRVTNKRQNAENSIQARMYQVELKAYAKDGSAVFLAENLCREVLSVDEFYFEQRPIFARGRGCAAVWDEWNQGHTTYVKTDFIPQYEFPGVSPNIEGADKLYFSMRFMAKAKHKNETLNKLNFLADSYENWINEKIENNSRMKDSDFRNHIGISVIEHCRTALLRIREGIQLIETDKTTFEAFCFMNSCMILQRNILDYSKVKGAGVICNFGDFTKPDNPKTDFGWRPFQIAFILMNLAGIVDPLHKDHEIVDLLYFPTGGGKTEAYLGLMAFTMGNRRLRAKADDLFNRDGGVTAILRYTLRLLTTQQRDRITKMIVAAEYLRKNEENKNPQQPKYGKEPFSIGFWVGGGVTPNRFSELDQNPAKMSAVRDQLLVCPFCGEKLKEDDFKFDIEGQTVTIHCHDKDCYFYKYGPEQAAIPVYLIDEEIYNKCPTIILSTVDKWAKLPWDVKTNALFGRVDRKCDRHGYLAIGEEHAKRHNKTAELPAASTVDVRPFLPPELIIQDELHLITGPLGTIYGAYETVIEDMCTYDLNGKTIKPKYVVSTATIKNASDQTKCLYARKNTSQFPPNGFEIGDSFFVREIPTKDDPFRKYVGVCAPGQSVKTTLLRIYAILLQKAFDLYTDEELKTWIDPYYTLIGYYNSIRELGGTVRLLQDDIPSRIKRIRRKYNLAHERYLNENKWVEITSRMSSRQIPDQLKKLETPCSEKGCLDLAIATNMIAVGMDVDRLGLMVVTGQPKQNSEYIQATSRIGRTYPGLVVTLYNPYRPRDLSHYENFTGYHSQLYRFVEGTTSTPFSARARDRVLHALIISELRLKYPQFAANNGAANIGSLTDEQLDEIKKLVMNRMNLIKPGAKKDAESEIDQFIQEWKLLAGQAKPLLYYILDTNRYNRLMNYYGQPKADDEKATLNSMREVESSAHMYYYRGD